MRSLLAPIANARTTRQLHHAGRYLAQTNGEAPFNIGPKAPPFAQFARTDHEALMRTYGTEPVLFASVNRLATSVASLEWELYTKARSRRKNDRVPVETGHAALDLWDAPNPHMTTDEFVEVSDQHLELTGETYWVLGFDDRANIPLSLWPVRPDRMIPVPHPTRFLAGYFYVDWEGQKVPFPTEQVIHLKYPDPLDPYHGLGPVRSLLTDLGSSVAAAKWNENFFTNSAEPGGLIKVDRVLSDPQWDLLNDRWNSQHRGYANAHRVAILEAGMEWQDRAFTMRDMQFVQLREASDTHIMLAFGMSKTLLGQTEGVNRATAEAAEYVFAKYQIVPRGRRIRNALNRKLLPFYGRGQELEFDFVSPVTGDVDTEARDRESRVQVAVSLIAAGFDPVEVAVAYDLPEMALAAASATDGGGMASPRDMAEMVQKIYLGVNTVLTWEEAREVLRAGGLPLPRGVPQPAAPQPALPAGRAAFPKALPPGRGPGPGGGWSVRPRGVDDPPDLDPDDLPDVTPLEESHSAALAALLEQWADLEDAQKAELVAAVLAIAGGGALADLDGLTVDTSDTSDALAETMTVMYEDGAEALAAEADEQGVTIKPAEPDTDTIDEVAGVVAGMIAARLVTSAKNTALRVNSTAATPEEVADAVEAGLADLSTDGPKPMLSGALTGSQNDGRIDSIRNGPQGAIYSSEKNDANTCGPCREIDGKWLGNVDELDQVLELYPGGAYGGYVHCDGRERCRGTITGVWRRGR